MDIFWQFLILAFGFLLLIKGADFLVDGSSGIARKLRISEAVIGMTIVAFGTSAPEFSVAMQAFAAGSTDLTLGDVIGCAISNILLLLGIAAVIRPIKIGKDAANKEIPFYLLIIGSFVAIILFAFFRGESIGRIGGAILVSLFLIFFYMVLRTAKKKRKTKAEAAKSKKTERKIWISILITLGGLIGVIIGSNLVVNSATEIAIDFGVSERIIAMTIVALGTSLPELMTTIVAAKKNEQELLLGDAIGSNIFNICFALGLPTLIYGNLDVSNFKMFDLIAIVVAAIMLFVTTRKNHIITRFEGIVMLALFVVYYTVMLVWT